MMIPYPGIIGLLIHKTKTTDVIQPYSVLIPIHNKMHELKLTLDAVYAQSVMPEAVVVVDDKSTDGSLSFLKSLNYPNITIIELEKNVGKANAINIALESIDTPIVFIVDADTMLAPTYCAKVLTGFVDDVVGCSGRVLALKHDTAAQKSRTVEYLYSQRMAKMAQVKLGGVWVGAGCGCAYNVAWLKSVGGMPTRSLVEDLELSWIAQRDHSLNYIHDAIMYTVDPEGVVEYIKQCYRWFSWRSSINRVGFSTMKRGLKCIIGYSLLEIGFAIAFLAVVAGSLATGNYLYLLCALLSDWLIYMIVGGYEGYKAGELANVVESVPYTIVFRYLNLVILLYALVRPKKLWY